ncbi:UbiD family decarboxylase [Saccharolobus islandicus]|uniref:3-polyprenyl-4-hydroxybenzoate decarboxylase andrelated decarboxylase n=4 Tax=Saccharolobus islandicus TaxID=43080 RepID=M9UDM1_SACIS|nr:UbiD family decarboxylase [Sulfolobus islandicus]ACP38093.1 UbiD family decarboxylase [Sulfolobus islandicus M.14.25]ACP55272.1 UbiD family decarboxylase [Sulfolobus islandicus M.16.27]ACR41926.1 UbiD family decarboxylase [Sulfolobus islandicus M.16.4]AGJ62646.1 3-polyprenyl-4-hydroxybenzoate decarboxylase andrelated decarboxylase [Sulfolobus islandicus LAL14/1]
MAFKDLRDYIEFMKKRNKLIEVDEEVSVDLEITEITRKATYAHLPPLLFKRIKNYENWKIISNIFYSIESFYEIFGTNKLESISEGFLSNLSNMPITFFDKIKSLREILGLGKVMPKAKTPSFKEEKNLDLAKIPAIKTWPKDAGRYLTFSITITKDPETDVHNLSVYRIQILNEKEAIIHWQAFKRGALTAKRYLEKGTTKIPIAIVTGVDPAIAFTAASPVPHGIDKYMFAGILRGEGVDVTELDDKLLVPSHSEVVLTGYVDLNDMRLEGPFGDHMGYYTPADYYPVFKLEKVYIREDPIFHVTSVGKPPLEDAWIGKAVERIFLPFAKMLVPELVDMNLPEYGLFTGIGIFSIKKYYPGQAKRVMMALWGTGQLSLLKTIIIVDQDIDVHDINQVIYAIAANVDPKRDVWVIENALTDSLDPSVPFPPLGSKLGIDATRKFKEEMGKEWPEEVRSDEGVAKKADEIINKIIKRYQTS